ncbi:hypothetical protein OE88DRAFT_909542 [Heliocybe sulcata]|uniref:Uncharacterized protein n=1 Tax=Heliocybe sulcata TaxID=5364 RepID=A0A5C3MMT6_9AGAM|nr:hypothetical protein OE88DRAFT_909542 [Heliocybe sulcata]
MSIQTDARAVLLQRPAGITRKRWCVIFLRFNLHFSSIFPSPSCPPVLSPFRTHRKLPLGALMLLVMTRYAAHDRASSPWRYSLISVDLSLSSIERWFRAIRRFENIINTVLS